MGVVEVLRIDDVYRAISVLGDICPRTRAHDTTSEHVGLNIRQQAGLCGFITEHQENQGHFGQDMGNLSMFYANRPGWMITRS